MTSESVADIAPEYAADFIGIRNIVETGNDSWRFKNRA